MKIKVFTILFLTFVGVGYYGVACSTFMLKKGTTHILGHNLDMGGSVPGMVFINKRGVQKEGHTWQQLTALETDRAINISWISKYGSVTFNAFGRELPDGGMNEKGLFVWEMTGGTTFDTVENRPRLFMAQWIQYQLDNFSSVTELLDNLSAIGMDGWNWHFFISDKQGESASIEFIDGIAMVNTKNNMPIPLMGNGRYSDDLSFINEFEGFGGNIEVDLNDPHLPGMVKGAKMLKDYNDSENSVAYGFEILKQLSGKVSKWAIIFDVNSMTVYFRTAQHPSIKSFAINAFYFSADTPVQIIDIQNENLSDDVTADFENFSQEANHRLITAIASKLYKAGDFEISKDTLINRLATVYISQHVNTQNTLSGSWEGYAVYPTTGEPAKVNWTVTIENRNGENHGKITDSAGLLADTEIKNMRFENGIFSFAVYAYGYVFKISANVFYDEIVGIFDISNESRKGNFYLQKKVS
ncbi:MAG: linear amide C-N hydrolase [Bacteroidetes bacterium]|nr:linear amide C-N hydrolase [Bacteroidota bacterium]